MTIDSFLAENPKFRDIGKAAIAHFLIACENERNLSSSIRHEKKNERAAFLEDSWYQFLWNQMLDIRLLTEEDTRDQFYFITFNYDRSLEHFLYKAMSARFTNKIEDGELDTDLISC